MEFSLIFALFGAALLAVFMVIKRGCLLVQQAEVVVIERLGRYHTTLTPGFHFIIPFIDVPRTVTWTFFREVDGKRFYRFTKTTHRIDLRETVYDFPRQGVITRDNVTMEINAILYYHVTNPRAAIYEVADLSEAIEKLTQTTLRNVIGSMDLDETLVSRDHINARLRVILDEASEKWGVRVNRVELQEVTPPADIRHAMEKQMRAERDRRAIILEAEGAKQAAILRAEGERESQVLAARGDAESKLLRAQGDAEARLMQARAEAEALERIRAALPSADPVQYLLALEYLKTLPKMAEGKNDKLVILPYEATATMGSLSAIKKLFE